MPLRIGVTKRSSYINGGSLELTSQDGNQKVALVLRAVPRSYRMPPLSGRQCVGDHTTAQERRCQIGESCGFLPQTRTA